MRLYYQDFFLAYYSLIRVWLTYMCTSTYGGSVVNMAGKGVNVRSKLPSCCYGSLAVIAPCKSKGILCSDRRQSCDAFQTILLEETSSRCNYMRNIGEDFIFASLCSRQFSRKYNPRVTIMCFTVMHIHHVLQVHVYVIIQHAPPWGRRGFKSRIRPLYSQRVVKGD